MHGPVHRHKHSKHSKHTYFLLGSLCSHLFLSSCFIYVFSTPSEPPYSPTQPHQLAEREQNWRKRKRARGKAGKRTAIKIRTEEKQWHKQKNSRKHEKLLTVLFSENNIPLFGCGQSRISLCQHYTENYSIRQTQEEMRKDKGTNTD